MSKESKESKENKETIDYFNKVEKELIKLSDFSGGIGEGIFVGKTKLSKTSKQARVRGRIDTTLRGEEFDESETPEMELETVEDDTIDELINRRLDNIFGE